MEISEVVATETPPATWWLALILQKGKGDNALLGKTQKSGKLSNTRVGRHYKFQAFFHKLAMTWLPSGLLMAMWLLKASLV